MENKMTSAMSALHFLTSNIREPKSKEYLRPILSESLVKTGDFDEAEATEAVDAFYTGLRAV